VVQRRFVFKARSTACAKAASETGLSNRSQMPAARRRPASAATLWPLTRITGKELLGGWRGVIDARQIQDLAADALNAQMRHPVAISLNGDARFANFLLGAVRAREPGGPL
jgi:hypothetical protein